MPASPQEAPHEISTPHHVWASAIPSFNPSNDLGSSFPRDPGDPRRAAQGTFQYTPALGAHLCVHSGSSNSGLSADSYLVCLYSHV